MIHTLHLSEALKVLKKCEVTYREVFVGGKCMTKQEEDALFDLGFNIRRLSVKAKDSVECGKAMRSLIAAAVKAALPGRQSEENTKELQQAAQKAFARKLARKVARL